MEITIDKLRESEIGRKIIELIDEEELYKYDPEPLNSLYIDAVIKYSREQKEKLKVQHKKVDFPIRGLHETEIPLVIKQSEKELQQRHAIQLAERERAIEQCERLVCMENDKEDFLLSIRGQRHEDFNILTRERKNGKKQKQQKEERKQRKIQAEKKREQDERLALSRAANDANNKKLDEQTRKQREREAEMDKKLQEPRETPRVPPTAPVRRCPPPNQADIDKTDTRVWRRPQWVNENSQQSHVDVKDGRNSRNEDQRPRTGNDRPSNQHSGESSSSTFWKSKTHSTDETRDSSRSGPNTSDQWQRPDDSNNWRTQEKRRLNSWRANGSNDEKEPASSDNRPTGGNRE
ncbi:unnamed protein product [Rotaria magnacalcarata]